MISSIDVHSVPLGLFGISIAHWPFLKVYHTCGCNDEPVMSIFEHPAIVGENQTIGRVMLNLSGSDPVSTCKARPVHVAMHSETSHSMSRHQMMSMWIDLATA